MPLEIDRKTLGSWKLWTPKFPLEIPWNLTVAESTGTNYCEGLTGSPVDSAWQAFGTSNPDQFRNLECMEYIIVICEIAGPASTCTAVVCIERKSIVFRDERPWRYKRRAGIPGCRTASAGIGIERRTLQWIPWSNPTERRSTSGCFRWFSVQLLRNRWIWLILRE